MTSELVTIIPFFDSKTKGVVLYVNARFQLHNPDGEQTLHVGFPEMNTEHYSCINPASEEIAPKALRRNKKPGSPFCSGKDFNSFKPHHRRASSANEPSIIAFWASAAGRPLEVQDYPGKDDYRRWFVFQVKLPGKTTTTLKNVYLSYPNVRIRGLEQTEQFTPSEAFFTADYVLHTGALWNGFINHGVVALRAGGFESRVEFNKLKPTRADDVHFVLGTLNSSLFERTRDLSDKNYLLRASSQPRTATATHSPASVLDGDPDTAWVSGKPGLGSWIQLPLRRLLELPL